MGNSHSVDDEIEIPYDVQTAGYRLWMFGDSILDNSYHNGVEQNTTAEWLKELLPKVEIKDRSTEELDAKGLLQRLEAGRKIQVSHHFVWALVWWPGKIVLISVGHVWTFGFHICNRCPKGAL